MEIWQMLLIVCPLVFFGSLVDSIAGGGGLITLTSYLITGMPPALASGSNKLSASIGAVTATISFHKAKKIRWKEALAATAGAIPGAVLGARLLVWLSVERARLLLFIVIPCAAVAVALLPRRKGQHKFTDKTILLISFLIGLITGAYDGLIGPGTGTFMILLFSGILGMELITASGCAKAVNLASNIGALITMISSGNVMYAVALPAAVFSIAGARLGSRLAIKGGGKFISIMLYVVLGLMLIWLAWNIFMA